jgi:hypothetical protein
MSPGVSQGTNKEPGFSMFNALMLIVPEVLFKSYSATPLSITMTPTVGKLSPLSETDHMHIHSLANLVDLVWGYHEKRTVLLVHTVKGL